MRCRRHGEAGRGRGLRAGVFIPTVAGRRHIADALGAMGADWRARCTVVDNASSDGTREAVRERFPDVRLVELDRNHGFGAAINAAVRESPADPVVILNDDVCCPAGALDRLVAPFADPSVGMTAGILTHASDGTIDSAGIRCDPSLGSIDALKGLPVDAATSTVEIVGPTGGLAAYRRGAFDAAGGFDEGFFAYYEDLDLALRLRQAGWQLRVLPEARGVHLGSATLGWRSLEKARIVGESRGRMIAKYGVARRPSAWPWLALETAAALALCVEMRSAEPARARVRGWRACRTRLEYPAGLPSEAALVDLIRSRLQRRYGGRAAT